LLKKIQAPAAGDICAQFQLSEEAQPTFAAAMPPADFLERLIAARHWNDAVRFLAHALPKREAVWWACICARATLTADAPPAVAAALQAAEDWVFKPVEENRRAAMVRAEASQFKSPASWAAVAAFWSGGSMAPPEAPPVMPPENLTATAVAGAVILATVQTEPQHAERKYRAFLESGIDIAKGGDGRPRQPAAGAP
jgi:hypothetical protein